MRAVIALLGLEAARFGHDRQRCIVAFGAIARAALVALLPGGALVALDAPPLVRNSEKSVHSAIAAQIILRLGLLRFCASTETDRRE